MNGEVNKKHNEKLGRHSGWISLADNVQTALRRIYLRNNTLMDLYLLNSTNAITPVNGTSRVQPLNLDPATIGMIVSKSIEVGVMINGLIQNRRANRIAQGQAHADFMALVYQLPAGIIPQNMYSQIHAMGEVSLEAAAEMVNQFIAKAVAEEEAKMAEQTAIDIANSNIDVSGREWLSQAISNAASRENNLTTPDTSTSKNTSRTPTRDTVQDTIEDNTDRIIEVVTKQKNTGVRAWWAARSNIEKGLMIGSTALSVAGLIYVFTRKKSKKSK